MNRLRSAWKNFDKTILKGGENPYIERTHTYKGQRYFFLV